MAPFGYELADVFADRPFAGNQLAVFPTGADIDEELLQPIARELNLSETVFVYPPTQGGDLRVRLFSTVGEVPFAGHPILGTACVMAQDAGTSTRQLIRVETDAGTVPVEVDRLRDGRFSAWMEQPVPTVAPFRPHIDLLRVLDVAGAELPVDIYDNGARHVFVALDEVTRVRAVVPDFAALGRVVDPERTNLVGISCFAGGDGRYTTRVFFPYDLNAEDAGCGSAAGPLAVHLLRHGQTESGVEIVIAQGEQVGRVSTLRAVVRGTPERIESVRVGGHVCLVGHGQFNL